MNKTILIAMVGIMIFGGVIWVASPDSQEYRASSLASNESSGTLQAEENNYDFGTISMADGNVGHQFKIKNTGVETVTIDKVYTSCMCTTAWLLINGKEFGPFGMPGHGTAPQISQAINPNEEMIIEAIFDPTAHGPAGVGRIQRSIIIENRSAESIELQLVAMVTP